MMSYHHLRGLLFAYQNLRFLSASPGYGMGSSSQRLNKLHTLFVTQYLQIVLLMMSKEQISFLHPKSKQIKVKKCDETRACWCQKDSHLERFSLNDLSTRAVTNG